MNSFAQGEKAMPREYAMKVIAQTHHHWARTHGKHAHSRARPREGLDDAPADHVNSASRL